jgi:hypothetical protein
MGTSVAQSPTPILQFLSHAGLLNVGGSLLTQVGGVNYPTWQDAAGATALPNPIPLNSRGEISNTSGVSVPLFLATGVTYTFTLYDANGNQIWVDDNVTAQGFAAVGNMTDEKGSGGTFGFAANVDFTPGTTTSLTLAGFYGSAENLWVAFDGAEQGADTYTLSGYVLTFNAPIPAGTNKVYVKGGTTISIGTPSSGSVVDASVAAGSKLYNRIHDQVDVKDFGATGNGTTDDTAAFQAALTYLGTLTRGGALYVPAGAYVLSSQLALTLPNVTAGIAIRGDGIGSTQLIWAANGGVKITMPGGYGNSVNISNLSLLAGAAGTGNPALSLVNNTVGVATVPTEWSNITNVSIHGTDGFGAVNYWPTGISATSWSQINFSEVTIVGSGSQGSTPGYTDQGVGISLSSNVGTTAPPPGVGYNLSNCTLDYLLTAFNYGNYIQGVTMSGVSITGGATGIACPNGQSGNDWLSLANCQINVSTAAVNINGLQDLLVVGSYFLSPANGIGFQYSSAGPFTFSGNSFRSLGANTAGIVIASSNLTDGFPGVITGNSFYNFNTAIDLQASSASVNVQSNCYHSNSTNVTNLGTGNTIGGGSQ